MNDPTALARQHFLDGIVHFEANHLMDAERCFEAALALAPGRPSVLTNLGATRVRLGKFAEAAPLLREACAAESGNAEAWGHLGTACAELGLLGEALDAFDRALQLNPGVAEAWSRRGSLLREAGQLDEAATCFERAIALGADDPLHRYYLASVRGESPAAPPREYVQALFDTYAGEFQGHLVSQLRYRAHELLVDGLRALGPQRYASALDLGCGTGLCGPLVRPLVQRLDGVDLSAAMLARARDTGVYDQLFEAEIGAWLADVQRQDDLVLAADVFIYVGALEAVFRGVADMLTPGGVFAFSVEALPDGEDFRLMPSLRYAHSQAYVRRLAAQHGFVLKAVTEAPLREDQRQPVMGYYIYLQRP